MKFIILLLIPAILNAQPRSKASLLKDLNAIHDKYPGRFSLASIDTTLLTGGYQVRFDYLDHFDYSPASVSRCCCDTAKIEQRPSFSVVNYKYAYRSKKEKETFEKQYYDALEKAMYPNGRPTQ